MTVTTWTHSWQVCRRPVERRRTPLSDKNRLIHSPRQQELLRPRNLGMISEGSKPHQPRRLQPQRRMATLRLANPISMCSTSRLARFDPVTPMMTFSPWTSEVSRGLRRRHLAGPVVAPRQRPPKDREASPWA